jgi:membrane protease YdiL (CAAX protease family)
MATLSSASAPGYRAYFALTLAWSWAFWGAGALAGLRADEFPGSLLMILGGGGPPLAAILLTLLDRNVARRRDYWRRIVDFSRIGPRWYVVIFLTAPLLSLLAVATHPLFGGTPYDFAQARGLLAQPLGLLPLAVGVMLFGPLPEELGWRGFALGRLQARRGALPASLVLAAVWAAWHVPLFFFPGTYQNGLGFGTASGWVYLAAFLPETLLMTWVFNHTRASTLGAILFHFATNFSGEFIETGGSLGLLRLAWAAALALVVSLGPWKGERDRGAEAA